jgi:hypothetical protein
MKSKWHRALETEARGKMHMAKKGCRGAWGEDKRAEPVPQAKLGEEVDALRAATMPVHSNRAHMACAVFAVNYRGVSTYNTLAEEPPIADRLREGGHFDTGRRLRCTSDQ